MIWSSLGMVWFWQLRMDQIQIKIYISSKLLLMLSNKLIKSVCGSGAEMIRNFYAKSDPDPK